MPNAYVLPVASSAYATSPTTVLSAHSIPKLLLIMRSNQAEGEGCTREDKQAGDSSVGQTASTQAAKQLR